MSSGAGDGDARPADGAARPASSLGVGLFWSILFMLVGLFGLSGALVAYLVRAARAHDTIEPSPSRPHHTLRDAGSP